MSLCFSGTRYGSSDGGCGLKSSVGERPQEQDPWGGNTVSATTLGWLFASRPFPFLLVNEGLWGQRPSRLLALTTAQRCSHLRLARYKPSVSAWAKTEVRTWAEGVTTLNETLMLYCEVFKMNEVDPWGTKYRNVKSRWGPAYTRPSFSFYTAQSCPLVSW